MTTIVATYLGYMGLSIAATVWIGHTLRRRGQLFLVHMYGDHPEMPSAMSDLLAVGFYLLHIGFAMMILRYGSQASSLAESIEVLSMKIGIVLVVLAVSHFAHVYVFSRMRTAAIVRASTTGERQEEPLTAQVVPPSESLSSSPP